MIKFKLKNFGKSEVIEFIKTPAGLIATTALGVSSANMLTNLARHTSDKKYQKKQLSAMDKLTNSLYKVDGSLKKATEDIEIEPDEPKILKFRRKNKDFSISSDIIESTAKGATFGVTLSSILNQTPLLRKKPNEGNDWATTSKIVGVGTLVGAGLGLLYGVVKTAGESYNRKHTVNQRLMKTVVENLKKSGLQEGKDFTRDPKRANELKTKVCIIISRESGDLQLLVNTQSDFKLKRVSDEMIGRIPNEARINKKFSDRYNDIEIAMISDSSADAGLVTGIVEFYVHNGFPVYMVEVG